MSDNTLIAAEVIAAFVSNNSIPPCNLPTLIRAVVGAFDNLGKTIAIEEPAPKPVPAVPIKKSVTDEYLISLEDGKQYRTLKRHLSSLGLTPEAYRSKWGLAADYPMVARGYSAARSELSKALGLGRKKAIASVEAPPVVRKARSKAAAPVEAEAATTTTDSVQEAIQPTQEAA